MRAYQQGAYHALAQYGLQKLAQRANPLIQGAKVETAPETDTAPKKPPKTPVWPQPPYSTSGTLLNPKVASKKGA